MYHNIFYYRNNAMMDEQILYRQIYHTLKAEIQNGHYPPGSQLPTEAALIQRFGVSRVTVRNALALLQQEGFVVRIPAKGTFVRQSEPSSSLPKLIALLALDVQLDFFGKIIRGAEQEAAAHGYKLLVRSTDNDAEKERQCLLELQSHVAGFVIAPATGNQNHAHYGQLLVQGVPFVFVDRYLPEFNVDRVTSDNVQGGYLATRHLLELGHRRIGVISGPDETIVAVEARLQGVRRTLAEHGCALPEEYVAPGDFTPESGYEAARRLMSHPSPPTAIFALNDRMAIGAIHYLREAGYRIPGDVSVIGFDDVPLAELFDPPLTTIRQPALEMGQQAARVLFDLIRGYAPATRTLVLPVDLVVRKSTAPLKQGAPEKHEISSSGTRTVGQDAV
ncbi:MAG: GntR family transcriptional regulator [Chloroflexi bacterium]|nr:MAG: GntR family transcriptional regulator [Chloroflexota bacterium]